jgi:hypothetical protein
MAKGGKGPLLACNNIDLDLIWKRLYQLQDICKTLRETVNVEVHGAVERGLLVSLFGIRGFLPISHIKKEGGSESWLTQSDLEVGYFFLGSLFLGHLSHDNHGHVLPIQRFLRVLQDSYNHIL